MNKDTVHNIVMLDDDDFLVDMYATKFSSSGIKISAFKNGQQLLDYLKTVTELDLILLDIVVPGMNGIETLKQIRDQDLAKNIPVVMLTNQNDESDLEEAKKLNVSGYIVKSSATPSEVVAEVIKIINESKNK